MLLKTEGKISEIKVKSDFFGSIIIKKRVRGLIQPVVFEIKGDIYKKCVRDKYYREGDKVRIWFVPICKKFNDKYFTNLHIEKMDLLENSPSNLFNQMVDTETGEIFE
jgi:hypothetical protein